MSECVVNNEENLWIIKILDSLLMVPEEILRKRKQVRILLYLREYSKNYLTKGRKDVRSRQINTFRIQRHLHRVLLNERKNAIINEFKDM